jgi:membrane protein
MTKHAKRAPQGHNSDRQEAEDARPTVRFGRLRARLRARGPLAFVYHFYWVEHQAADLASGIAFRLLINLFPLFSVVGTIVSLFLRNSDYALRVLNILYQLFPTAWESQITALALVGQNAGAFGIIGFLVLCWFSTTLLESIGHAFFHHYDLPIRRTLRLRGVGLLLIVALAVVLVATVFLTSVAAWLGDEVQLQFGADAALWRLLVQIGTSLAGYVLAFSLLFSLYLLIPDVGLRPRNVWLGALLGATLFAIALQLFPLYLRFRPVSASGGTIGFVFLLTTWLYLLAHILLIGNALNAYRWRKRGDCPTPEPLV